MRSDQSEIDEETVNGAAETATGRLPLLNVYIDDSGTRHPNHAPPTSVAGDWFALGGVVIREEDEAEVLRAHTEFCSRWGIDYPLHSVKIRNRSKKFAWLASETKERQDEFYADLDAFMLSIPVLGHSCVIDRPGYHHRYYEQYGRQRWHLCKTAFSVICERVAKFAVKTGRRVRIYVEETDKPSDNRLREYFAELRGKGMPFDQTSSAKYGPLSKEEMAYRLVELRFKTKSSPLIQIADLYLYPLCRRGYGDDYGPANDMNANGKIIDNILDDQDRPVMGVKYSCFDTDSKKGPDGTLKPASETETS